MADYIKSPPPHIVSSGSITKIIWFRLAALVPLLLLVPFYSGLDGIRVLLAAAAGAYSAEMLAQVLLRQKARLQQGTFLYIAVLFAFMLPSTVPAGIVFTGSFAAVFIGKEIFGGMGSFIVHPVLLGYAMVHLCYSKSLSVPAHSSQNQYLSFPIEIVDRILVQNLPEHVLVVLSRSGPTLADSNMIAALVCCALVLIQKLGRWEVPLVFMAVLAAANAGSSKEVIEILSAPVLLSAFFYLMMPGLGPTTREGRRIFAAGAALLTMILWRNAAYFAAFSYAVLFMNILTPWIDEFVRPKLSRLSKIAVEP